MYIPTTLNCLLKYKFPDNNCPGIARDFFAVVEKKIGLQRGLTRIIFFIVSAFFPRETLPRRRFYYNPKITRYDSDLSHKSGV